MIKECFPIIIGEEVVRNEHNLLARVEDGAFMPPESIHYLILHCSATRCNSDYPAEQLLRDHLARGFRTVGYHFYIRRDGTMTQHRHLLEVGAHCRPFNRCSIGICYEGGLDEEGNPADTRTPQQRERIATLLASLRRLFPNAKVKGHREMPGVKKDCPCFDCEEYR